VTKCFVKNRPKRPRITPKPLLGKKIVVKLAKMGYLCYFLKLAQAAKIRPIWSPCFFGSVLIDNDDGKTLFLLFDK
jgi:hypothetical protein